MHASQTKVAVGLSDQLGAQLAEIDGRHQLVLRSHDRVRRELNECIEVSERAQLLAAWQRYRLVVAQLDSVTNEIEMLRLSAE
jgi:hypothetical protein